MNNILFTCTGCTIGFCTFLYNLEAPGMGNVLFRPDSNNIRGFSKEGLIDMLIRPFTMSPFWTAPILWPVNWVVMTVLGGTCFSTLAHMY